MGRSTINQHFQELFVCLPEGNGDMQDHPILVGICLKKPVFKTKETRNKQIP